AGIGLRTPERPLPFRAKQRRERGSRARIDPKEKRLLAQLLAKPEDAGLRAVYIDLLLERDDPRGALLSLATSDAAARATYDQLVAAAFPWPEITAALYGDLTSAEKRRLRAELVALVCFLAWGTRFEPAYGLGRFYRFIPQEDDPSDAVEPYTKHA